MGLLARSDQTSCFYGNFILAVYKGMHISLSKCKFRPDPTTNFGVICILNFGAVSPEITDDYWISVDI